MAGCAYSTCDRLQVARGHCEMHYRRLLRSGVFGPVGPMRERRGSQCSLAECERSVYARQLCGMHYQRLTATGEVGPSAALVLVGQVGCSVEECARAHEARGFCAMHYRRWKAHGDPRIASPSGNHRGDQIGYRAAHLRVEARRGKASSFPCLHCGSAAEQWAYDGADLTGEKLGQNDGSVCAFSTDPDHYLSLCRPCHRSFDARDAISA